MSSVGRALAVISGMGFGVRFRGVIIGVVGAVAMALSAGSVSASPSSGSVTSSQTGSAGASGSSAASQTVTDMSAAATPTTPGAFVPLTQKRVLDTRYNNGASGPVRAKGTAQVQILGRGGVPKSGVSAVVLNVTVTSAKAGGYVTVYPSGKSRPKASNVNFAAGRTVPNLVTVRVGSNGKLALYNGSGKSVQLIGDVAGYYKSGSVKSAGMFVSLNPTRVLDTRYKNGASGPVAAKRTVHLQVTGRGGVPKSGVVAVVMNVTVTSAKGSGYVTVFSDGKARPKTSNVNFGAGQTVANLVTVRLGSNGKVSLYNGSKKTVQLVADVAGYYRGGSAKLAGAFVSLNPARVLDTRSKNGASGPVAAKRTVHLLTSGRGGVRKSEVSSVVMNVTVTSAKGSGYVTVFPDGTKRPTASNVNFSAGRTVANLVNVKLGGNGKLSLFNSSTKTMHMIGDVSGYFLSKTLITGSSITAGSLQTCARTTSGRAICWGRNSDGALGNGTTRQSARPVQVSGLSSGVKSVAAGDNHTCAVTDAGSLKCWGQNDVGQLGNGTKKNSLVPVTVKGLSSGVKAVSLGRNHTCAITTTGVKCWGSNGNGQLGNGTRTDSPVPVNVSGLSSGVKSIAAGGFHSCAVTSAGAAKCWGMGIHGQVGARASEAYTTPVTVYGLSKAVSAVSAGSIHSCALSESGYVSCWGFEQGNRSDPDWPPYWPYSVPDLPRAKAVASRERTSCAITAASGAMCWGQNFDGQLGDGTYKYSRLAVPVVGLSSGVRSISVGTQHSCAMTTAGVAKCWGSNAGSQLGNSTMTGSTRPVLVADF